MTDEECIALAWLHCKGEPFWQYCEEHESNGLMTEVWYLRRQYGHNRETHEAEYLESTRSGRFYFTSRAKAARAYCEYHGLMERTHDAQNDRGE